MSRSLRVSRSGARRIEKIVRIMRLRDKQRTASNAWMPVRAEGRGAA